MIHFLHFAVANLKAHGYYDFVKCCVDWLESEGRLPEQIVARGIGRMDEHTQRIFSGGKTRIETFSDDSITELAALVLWDKYISEAGSSRCLS